MPDKTPKIVDKTPDSIPRGGVGALARRYVAGTRLEWHRHETGQLLFAASGTILIETHAGRWVLPPEKAVWLPPRAPHALDMGGAVEMRSAYVQRHRLRLHPGLATGVRVIEVSALLGACLRALCEEDPIGPRRACLVELMLDEAARAPLAPTFLPLPADRRMVRVARLVLERPRGRADLSALARQAGLSTRSLSRAFPAETGMTFKAWRRRARMQAAVTLLGAGRTPKAAAAALGYSSQSAFAAAFRAEFGRAPRRNSRKNDVN